MSRRNFFRHGPVGDRRRTEIGTRRTGLGRGVQSRFRRARFLYTLTVD